jgi:anti-sigma factor RsiW
MSCDPYRELLALRLYDELDDGERRRLEGHLARCPACRAAEVELRAGLGRLIVDAAPAELPADWAERLHEEVATAEGSAAIVHRPGWWRLAGERPVAAAAVVGFAAGVLFAWLVATGGAAPAGVEDRLDRGAEVASASGFRRADPPPLAARGGGLTPLATWLQQR